MQDAVKSVQIFVSYASEDAAEIAEFCGQLEQKSFRPWPDHRDSIAGAWLNTVIGAFPEARVFIPVISQHYQDKKTGELVAEVLEALRATGFYRHGHFHVFPVRLVPFPLPSEFLRFQSVDLFQPDGLTMLIQSLERAISNSTGFDAHGSRSEKADVLPPGLGDESIREPRPRVTDSYSAMTQQSEYEPKSIEDDQVVVDHSTGLWWQQSGSEERVTFREAKDYVADLNEEKFAGFDDWRLPSLDEAMTLIQLPEAGRKLSLNSLFDEHQNWIWTADLNPDGGVMSVNFDGGFCPKPRLDDDPYVRAVRFSQTSE